MAKYSMENVEKLIEDLVKAICYLYSGDATKPSLILSHLGKDKFYLSIARYHLSNSRDKYVVFKTEEKTLFKCLSNAANFILKQKNFTTNPIDELRNSLDNVNEIPF